MKKLVNLEGTWRFSIGDNPKWSDINFVTKNWDYVYVPQNWERAGYIGYDGYAWYRKEFKFDTSLKHNPLYLVLGYIDDVDEVYLNGQLVGGSGIFPPVVTTSYSLLRKYYLPLELLKENNVIAIRVYDEYEGGGIFNGPLGIYFDKDDELLEKNLAGYWNIHNYSINNDIETNANGTLYLPGHVESRGYTGIKGSVIYTKEFALEDINKENIWLVLGYIDGNEKVYLNDYFIGEVEEFQTSKNSNLPAGSIFRSYKIPEKYLHSGINKIRLELENISNRGGITQGPIGLIYKDKLEVLKKVQKKKPVYFWEEFFKEFFE